MSSVTVIVAENRLNDLRTKAEAACISFPLRKSMNLSESVP